MATRLPSITAAPAASPFTANMPMPTRSENAAVSRNVRGRPPEIGSPSVVFTFIWTTPPAGACSSSMRRWRSTSSLDRPTATDASASMNVSAADSVVRDIDVTVVPP